MLLLLFFYLHVFIKRCIKILVLTGKTHQKSAAAPPPPFRQVTPPPPAYRLKKELCLY